MDTTKKGCPCPVCGRSRVKCECEKLPEKTLEPYVESDGFFDLINFQKKDIKDKKDN